MKSTKYENMIYRAKKKKFTIGIIGAISGGKSSFLNAVSGGFISNVSLQRETLTPQAYIFSNNGNKDIFHILSSKLKLQHENNEKT